MYWISRLQLCVLDIVQYIGTIKVLNPFKPEFSIVIFIHYKPRIAVAFWLVVDEDDLKWVANVKKILLFLKQLHENCGFKTTSCRKLSNFSEMQNDALKHHGVLNEKLRILIVKYPWSVACFDYVPDLCLHYYKLWSAVTVLVVTIFKGNKNKT